MAGPITPVILFPTSDPSFGTNIQLLTIGGTFDPSSDSLIVNGSSGGVTTDISGHWSYTATLLVGSNQFAVQTVKNNVPSGADILTVVYDPTIDPSLIAPVPSGIQLRRDFNSVKISAPRPSNANFVGFNFYGAEEPGGGAVGYTQFTTQPLNILDFSTTASTQVSQTVNTVGNQRTTTTVENITVSDYVSFTHNRQTNPLGINPITTNNSYVVTSVIFDATNKLYVESNYSEELASKPVVIDTQLKDIDARTENDFRVSIIDQILNAESTLDLKPGTVARDTFIDPAATMFSRLFTVLRFISTCQSFATLLAFDDPNDTGVSAPVATTPNKAALQDALLIDPTDTTTVQALIDSAFDKLASNVNVTRVQAQPATGQLTFYTKNRPVNDSVIQNGAIIQTLADPANGISAVQFKTLSGFTLQVANLSPFYNPNTGRYEVTIDVQAVNPGEAGNVAAGKIISVVSGVDSIFGVINNNPTEFGSNVESNRSLAVRGELAFFVDSGTQAGYFSNTISTPGVTRAIVITAGDPLMQRDLDSVRETHLLGKVDIYVQGINETTITDTFGFSWKKVINENFFIQSRQFYQFRSSNSLVDATHPIFDVIEVKNITRNQDYDVTGYTISDDGNVIGLDYTNLTNQTIGLGSADIIRVTYRYRRSDPVQFNSQPVERIVSVVGSVSGELTSANYQLVKQDDPLLLGNSTAARDEIEFIYGNGLPASSVITITGEPVVLTGFFPQSLANVNVDDTTIVVKDSLLNSYVINADYAIIPGTNKVPTQIARVPGSAIPDGATVFVSYECGEIMTVQYVINNMLTTVQTKIDTMKHITADVLVKSAQITLIDIAMTVSLIPGVGGIQPNITTIDTNIRTKIGNFLANANLGQDIHQSDIIALTEQVNGVDFVVVPFTKMVKANGVQVIREPMPNPQFVVYQSGAVTSYISTEKLASSTTDGGGPSNLFRGIFENDFLLNMVTNDVDVSHAAGNGYIRGDGKIIVSTRHGTDPNLSKYTVTYVAEGETGAKDIVLSSIEYAQINSLLITYAQTGQTLTGEGA